jgi:hypothetical protein
VQIAGDQLHLLGRDKGESSHLVCTRCESPDFCMPRVPSGVGNPAGGSLSGTHDLQKIGKLLRSVSTRENLLLDMKAMDSNTIHM